MFLRLFVLEERGHYAIRAPSVYVENIVKSADWLKIDGQPRRETVATQINTDIVVLIIQTITAVCQADIKGDVISNKVLKLDAHAKPGTVGAFTFRCNTTDLPSER